MAQYRPVVFGLWVGGFYLDSLLSLPGDSRPLTCNEGKCKCQAGYDLQVVGVENKTRSCYWK